MGSEQIVYDVNDAIGVTAFLEKRPAHFRGRPSVDMPPFYPWWTPRPFRA